MPGPEPDALSAIKDLAVIVGVVAGLLGVGVNWKALFCPYAKKVEDMEFESAAALLRSLYNPLFTGVYYGQQPVIDNASVSALWMPVFNQIASPFLPEPLRAPAVEFGRRYLGAGGVQWVWIRNSGEAVAAVPVVEREKLFEAHRGLHDTIVRWFNRTPSAFPFSSPSES